MKIPIANVYYLLCYAADMVDDDALVDTGTLERLERAQDLLGLVLARGTFRLIRRGIDRGYRDRTERLRGLRGRLELAAMVKSASMASGETVCTFEEFSPDVLHNRILRSTLALLRRAKGLDPFVRREVALAHAKLDGISEIRVTRRTFGRVQLDRNQRQYRFLLELCQLVHRSVLVDEHGDGARFEDFREKRKIMWRLFERFVAAFYAREQSAYRVAAQTKVPWDGLGENRPGDESFVPTMWPDLVLESDDRRIVLDTKFYREPLTSRFGKPTIRSGNLYQMMAYLENRQGVRPAGPRHEGLLLYATVDAPVDVDVQLRGFRVRALSVDLARPFTGIRAQLFDVIDLVREETGAQPAG